MNLESKSIDEVIQITQVSGNEVVEVSEGWAKVKKVVHMKRKLSDQERELIKNKLPNLRHWSTKGSPHNPAEEGFTCDESSVGITFPM